MDFVRIVVCELRSAVCVNVCVYVCVYEPMTARQTCIHAYTIQIYKCFMFIYDELYIRLLYNISISYIHKKCLYCAHPRIDTHANVWNATCSVSRLQKIIKAYIFIYLFIIIVCVHVY